MRHLATSALCRAPSSLSSSSSSSSMMLSRRSNCRDDGDSHGPRRNHPRRRRSMQPPLRVFPRSGGIYLVAVDGRTSALCRAPSSLSSSSSSSMMLSRRSNCRDDGDIVPRPGHARRLPRSSRGPLYSLSTHSARYGRRTEPSLFVVVVVVLLNDAVTQVKLPRRRRHCSSRTFLHRQAGR
jgi:hypothetical protein